MDCKRKPRRMLLLDGSRKLNETNHRNNWMNYIIKVKVNDDDKDEGMNEMGVEFDWSAL